MFPIVLPMLQVRDGRRDLNGNKAGGKSCGSFCGSRVVNTRPWREMKGFTAEAQDLGEGDAKSNMPPLDWRGRGDVMRLGTLVGPRGRGPWAKPWEGVEVPERFVGQEGGLCLAASSPGRREPLGRKPCVVLPAGPGLKCLRLVPCASARGRRSRAASDRAMPARERAAA